MRIKIIISVLLTGVLLGKIYSQTTLNALYNLPRQGDRIVKLQVAYKDPGMNGASAVWDFSDLEILNDKYTLKYDTLRGDTLISREHRTMYYYQYRNDTLLFLGYRNPTTLVSYREPETYLVFPFPYGRSITSYYDGKGHYCDRFSVHIQGVTTTEADAVGRMILPEGDTLQNVLRVHLSKKVVEKMEPIFNYNMITTDTIPFVICRDSIDYRLNNDSTHFEIDTWLWYANGYRYPIFETKQARLFKKKEAYEQFGVSYYYPPHEQYYGLDEDMVNWIKRNNFRNENEDRVKEIESVKSEKEYKDEIIAYRYIIDEQGELHIFYSVERGTDLNICLYDLQGRQISAIVRNVVSGENYQECISIGNYPSGSYLLRISLGERIYGEKIWKQ